MFLRGWLELVFSICRVRRSVLSLLKQFSCLIYRRLLQFSCYFYKPDPGTKVQMEVCEQPLQTSSSRRIRRSTEPPGYSPEVLSTRLAGAIFWCIATCFLYFTGVRSQVGRSTLTPFFSTGPGRPESQIQRFWPSTGCGKRLDCCFWQKARGRSPTLPPEGKNVSFSAAREAPCSLPKAKPELFRYLFNLVLA
jgi:hypothetical protein